jgi:hypothetical protein
MKTNSVYLNPLVLVVLATLLLPQVSPAPPYVMISTSATTSGSNWDVGDFIVAQQFTTGSQSENIPWVIADIGPTSSAGSGFEVSIFSDASGQVGSLLNNGLLTGAGSPTVNSNIRYMASGLTLAADTSYWVVFENPVVGSHVDVQDTQGGSLTTQSRAGWTTLSTTDYSSDGGTTYNSLANAVPLFEIDGVVATPEPSTLALAGLGGLGMLWQLRRRNS